MSLSQMISRVAGARVVGSILHGAYGDYYEQSICLKYLKQLRPELRLVLFFATESRRTEMGVYDFSFADEVLPASAIETTPVDTFVQFQVHDAELRANILSKLAAAVLSKFDLRANLKPWSIVGRLYTRRPEVCDVPLSAEGIRRLPQCFRDNALDERVFEERPTVGFLWRYRRPGGAISAFMQPSEQVIHQTKSELLSALAKEYGARIIVGGMSVGVTEENRERTDCKFSSRRLAVPDEVTTYLKGLNWGLELEIMRQCTLCIVMASGFSEALLMKRRGRTVLVDPPPHYVAKLLWNRMPFFNLMRPGRLLFQLRQPHSAQRVLKHLQDCDLLPTAKRLIPTAA